MSGVYVTVVPGDPRVVSKSLLYMDHSSTWGPGGASWSSLSLPVPGDHEGYLGHCSWAIIFRIQFSKWCTFGSKSGTKSLVRRYQAKFAVPEHLKVRHIWLITFLKKLMFSYTFYSHNSNRPFQYWIFTFLPDKGKYSLLKKDNWIFVALVTVVPGEPRGVSRSL